MDTLFENAVPNVFALGAFSILCLVLLGSRLVKRDSLSHVPIYEVSREGKHERQYPSLSKAVHAAFPKFRNGIFRLTGIWADSVVVPPKFIESLKDLPEDQLSFEEINRDRLSSDITGMKIGDDEASRQMIIKSVTVDLTRYIANVMKDLDDEIRYAFSAYIPACEDWTEVKPVPKLTEIVGLVSGRIFVGKPLNRDNDFLRCTIMYTIEVFQAAAQLQRYPRYLRRLASLWVPQMKSLRESQETMERLIGPVVRERLEQLQRGEKLKSDMTTWNILNTDPDRRGDIAFQARAQLIMSLAAIHTTSIQSSHTWLDLAAHPEYLEPLREEIAAVQATEPDGILSKTSMPKLKKLDSFLKESQRYNPMGATSFDRRVMTPYLTLPDGTKLPHGTNITVATSAIAHDPMLWEEPDRFDGFRFAKLRQTPGNENRYQFATTGPESMFFGHGKHACPGRFFAANEIKLFLVHLIMNYDVKLPEGMGRPANMPQALGGVRPDPEAKMLMRRRKV